MKITQTKDLRTANRMKIIRQVLQLGSVSRTELCSLTDLNKATVSTITKEWIDFGLLKETTRVDTQSGRHPVLLQACCDTGCILAIDLDIRRVELVLTDLSAKKEHCRTAFTINNPGFVHVYEQLTRSIALLLSQCPQTRFGVVGIGICVHGIVDLDGLIRFIPQLGWRNVDLRALLQEKYSLPVFIDNDGNFAALNQQKLWELAFLQSRSPQVNSLCVLNVGETISAGIITDGKLLRGQHGFAGAIGHHTINSEETCRCYCGKYGCFEQYCCDRAVIEMAQRTMEQPIGSIDELIQLVRYQTPAAEQVVDQFLRYLAIGLSNLIFIFDCESVVINSRLLNALPYYLPRLMEYTVLPITRTENVRLTHTSENICLPGAAEQVQEEFFRRISNELSV